MSFIVNSSSLKSLNNSSNSNNNQCPREKTHAVISIILQDVSANAYIGTAPGTLMTAGMFSRDKSNGE